MIGGMLGMAITMILIPAPEGGQDQAFVMLAGAAIGMILTIILFLFIYCCWSRTIMRCLLKWCPKKCCVTEHVVVELEQETFL